MKSIEEIMKGNENNMNMNKLIKINALEGVIEKERKD